MISVQDEKVRDHDSDHGCKDRSDQIEEVREIIHGQCDRADNTDHSGGNGDLFAVDLFGEQLTGDTCGISVQESCCDCGEDDDDQSHNTEACRQHDLGDIAGTGENGRAHSDDIHPAAHNAVDHGGPGGCRQRLLCLSRVVTDQGQPGQGHGDVEFDRRTEGQPSFCLRRQISVFEDDKGQDDSEDEEQAHGNHIDLSQALDSDHQPDNDQAADHQGPDPFAAGQCSVGRQRSVIDHDGGPADQLQNIQDGKQESTLAAKAERDRLHGAHALFAAHISCQEEEKASDHMSDNDRQQSPAEPQRGKKCSGQDLSQTDARSEPD